VKRYCKFQTRDFKNKINDDDIHVMKNNEEIINIKNITTVEILSKNL
jgi:hypothetical protein